MLTPPARPQLLSRAWSLRPCGRFEPFVTAYLASRTLPRCRLRPACWASAVLIDGAATSLHIAASRRGADSPVQHARRRRSGRLRARAEREAKLRDTQTPSCMRGTARAPSGRSAAPRPGEPSRRGARAGTSRNDARRDATTRARLHACTPEAVAACAGFPRIVEIGAGRATGRGRSGRGRRRRGDDGRRCLGAGCRVPRQTGDGLAAVRSPDAAPLLVFPPPTPMARTHRAVSGARSRGRAARRERHGRVLLRFGRASPASRRRWRRSVSGRGRHVRAGGGVFGGEPFAHRLFRHHRHIPPPPPLGASGARRVASAGASFTGGRTTRAPAAGASASLRPEMRASAAARSSSRRFFSAAFSVASRWPRPASPWTRTPQALRVLEDVRRALVELAARLAWRCSSRWLAAALPRRAAAWPPFRLLGVYNVEFELLGNRSTAVFPPRWRPCSLRPC